MISRLPKWVESGAFVLALIAGYVNAVGLLGFEHQSVSHVSGTATQVGVGLLNASMQQTLNLISVLVAFLVGAAVSGYLLHDSTLKLGRHYDTALYCEAGLLIIGAWLLLSHSFYGHLFASAACGLQNALATKYSGAVIRTTHLTGIFTDLGIMLGSAIRGEAFDKRKARLFLCIIVGFIVGGTCGAWYFRMWLFYALFVPAGVCIVLALVYRHYVNKQASGIKNTA
ncbi:YoaK family protein [Alteromonas sp. AMM-1]|uniref:YoaK family protein n=1 Tax=Alteromonas sp. AMM-1 TaxID=3394233 RepID=UPI0039A6CCEE